MLRKQDNDSYSHKLHILVLPLFNPIPASVVHTHGDRDWLPPNIFPDCNGTLRLFKVTGPKVSGRGQQAIFFFMGECARFKRPRVAG